jgi:pyrimidine operon attenuation protein/uracil phosphoribosyltransferase
MHKNYNVEQLLDQMAATLCKTMQHKNIHNPYIVGIHTAGVWVAKALYQRLSQQLCIEDPLGELNSSYYRDDFNQRGLSKQIQPSRLPISLEGRHIILVDDILFTGRTARAAINELFDYGRLASVTFAVLIDRGGQELPIHADVIGLSETLENSQSFKLINPKQLTLEIRPDNA